MKQFAKILRLGLCVSVLAVALSVVGLLLPVLPAAAPFAYVPNYSDNTLLVIDTATNTVAGHPRGNPRHGVATLNGVCQRTGAGDADTSLGSGLWRPG